MSRLDFPFILPHNESSSFGTLDVELLNSKTESSEKVHISSMLQNIKYSTEKIEELQSRMSSYAQQLSAIEKTSQNIKKDYDTLKKEIETVKIRNIETLGVFVGLFTFISIDFQVIKGAKNYISATGLICVSAGLLVGFMLVLDYFVNNKKDEFFDEKIRYLLAFVASSFILGLFLLRESFLFL